MSEHSVNAFAMRAIAFGACGAAAAFGLARARKKRGVKCGGDG